MKLWLGSVAAMATLIHFALISDFGRWATARPIETAASVFDASSLYLSGSSAHRRARLASIETVNEFPAGHSVRTMATAVGLLVTEFRATDGKIQPFTCTASLIRPTLVLTNAHCVLHRNQPASRITLWFDHLAASQATVVELVAAPVEIDVKLDYALLSLSALPAGATVTHLGQIAMRAAVPGERLLILHHSKGDPLQVSRAFCRAALDQVVVDQLRHSCPTHTGSSGAIVFAERDYAIVGLHHSISTRADGVAGYATAISAINKAGGHLVPTVATR